MSRILVIAEKPSVASDLARVLGKNKSIGKFTKDKTGTYFENDKLVITSAVGHLLEQRKPVTAEGKSLPWKLEVLPVIPDSFELEPISKSEDRLKKVLKLAKAKDIVEVVNACDAGREGELIFRNLERYGKWKLPVKRLWMQSMTDQAIMDAWNSLRSDEEMQPLADAAKCRSESDWLVGLNSTRALTVLQSRGGFNMTPSGRVQTPTLAILARREKEIRDFVAEPYAEVVATFGVSAGNYVGKWFDQGWKKDDARPHSRAERIWNMPAADEIKARCEGKSGVVTEETKPVRQIAPQLYDLTTLQREASSRYGFSAKRTLQLAQECYEKHKVLTYPRTDSRYLPDDYMGKVSSTIQAIAGNDGPLASYARDILDNGRVKPNKRVFDGSKVSDHFAIIPTGTFAALSGDVLRLYELVMARFLAVFFPPAEFLDTRRVTRIDHGGSLVDAFATNGRVLVSPGWLAVYGRTAGSSKEDLVSITQGEQAAVLDIAVEQCQTKPPARFNEATLLSAMEGAGKMLDDEGLREAMQERGLGTPATRAAIIEGLIAQEYIARDGRELVTTRRGMELIDLLKKIKLQTLTSPELTGEWEYKLKQMEQGRLDRPSFMEGIKHLTGEIVERIKQYRHQQQNVELEDLPVACPVCGAKTLRATMDSFSCRTPDCRFSVRRVISGREISEQEAQELISKGITPVLEGFTSRFGKRFDAALKLDEKFKVVFKAEDEPESDSAETLTEEQKIGEWEILNHGAHAVFETEKAWKIPSLVYPKEPKGLSISRKILSREIPREQTLKLLSSGKSDLLKGFVSQRTKRSFNAFLVFDAKTGKIGFEFEPREARPVRKGGKEAQVAQKGEADGGEAGAKKKPARKSPARKTAETGGKKAGGVSSSKRK